MTEPQDRPRLSDRQRNPRGGLECWNCGCHHFRVIYTTPQDGAIERRRECRNCGERITTGETVKF